MGVSRSLVIPLLGVVFWLCKSLYQEPHLAYYVPKIGWLLFVALERTIPADDNLGITKCNAPGSCDWLTPGDVVIDACGKCGTNWLMTIVHELRTWDKPHLKDFRDILEISPWLELRQFPEDYPETRHENWGNEWNNPELPFKQYKSHAFPHFDREGVRTINLPVRSRRDVKYIVMTRKPADMLVSLKHFSSAPADDFAALMGGFTMGELSMETILWVQENFPGIPIDIFHFFDSWYEYRNDPNVLFLHYTDVFKDVPKYIKKIADFLELDGITEEGLKEAERRTSVEFMKRGDRYRHLAGYNHTIPMLKSKSLIRKGGMVSKKEVSEISAEQMKRIEILAETRLGPEKAKILQEGFDQPRS